MFVKKYSYYILALGGILLSWWGVSAIICLPVIPSPILVLSELRSIFFKDILLHAFYSLTRISAGLLGAIIVGYPLGFLLGYYERIGNVLSPFIYFAYPIPKVALLPIIMLLFGIGELSKVLLIFLIIVFQIIIAVRDSICTIPAESFAVLYSLGASVSYIIKKAIIPASLPKFFSALRVAMATAVSVLFFSETFGTQYGIGYYIMDAWLRVNYLEMYCGIVVLSLIGISIFSLIDFWDNYFCHWQNTNKL